MDLIERSGNKSISCVVFFFLHSGYMVKLAFSGEGCVDGFKVTNRYVGKNMGFGRYG